jgi:hypothetical protein
MLKEMGMPLERAEKEIMGDEVHLCMSWIFHPEIFGERRLLTPASFGLYRDDTDASGPGYWGTASTEWA